MATPIAWSQAADAFLLQMRAAGLSWQVTAQSLHVGRSAAIERARCLGVPPMGRHKPAAKPRIERVDRPPLCPGHPVSWRAITAASCIEGQPYPFPVFL